MFTNSYHLPSAAAPPAPPPTGSAVFAPPPLPEHLFPPNPTPKRGPGRPPKPKSAHDPENGSQPAKKRGRPPKQQIQLPEHQIMMAPAEVPFVQPFSQPQPQPIPVNGPPVQKRRPGRPPKQPQSQPPVVPYAQSVTEAQQLPPVDGAALAGVKKRPGRPPKYNVGGPVVPVSGGTGRPRGRPKKNVLGPVARPVGKRPRGRPSKQGGFGAAVGMASGKRRGRPPKGSGPPKVRKLSGRPVGRPRKNAVKQYTSEQRMVNEELTRKLEFIQLKIGEAIGIIRPCVANENAALTVLQELEELVKPNVTAPATAPSFTATPMTVIAPPSGFVPVSAAVTPNLTAPPTMTVTAPPTGNVTAPAIHAPALFNAPLMPMNVTAPFQAPSGVGSQQPLSWMPSSEAQS